MQRLIRDGVGLAYEEAGSGSPPLLLVHCWCGDHSFMRPQLEHFRRDSRVVAVDLRGHGESDKPEASYTVSDFADDVAWFCRQLSLVKPVVIGHSMGGNVALELAVRQPDVPAAIVMIDSVIVPPAPLVAAFRQASEALRGPDFRQICRELVGSVALPTDDTDRVESVKTVMSSAPQYVMVNSFDQHILLWDGAAAAAACKVPALYIGAAAPLSDMARLRELWPRLTVGQTVGAGHFNHQEVPEQVNAMIERFLTTVLPEQAGTEPAVRD